MICNLCDLLCKWFCPDADQQRALYWQEVDEWERRHSNDWEMWSEQSDRARELNQQASELRESDPDAALRLRIEAADSGSVWAMQIVGWHYDTGTGVEESFDRSQEYYYRALCAGSWSVTIRYARLLERYGHRDHWEHVLQDGVKSDFVPSFYWLAWLRYKNSKSLQTRRDIRPLLERAVEAGRPAAEVMLGRLLLFGRYGLREIPRGVQMLRSFVAKRLREGEASTRTKPDEAAA